MAPLRVALLCHLFVSVAAVRADRIATNVACLTEEPDEVYLNFAGASATAFLEDFPRLTRSPSRRIELAAQQLGREGC